MAASDVKVEVKEGHKKEVDFKELSIEEAFELLKCTHDGLTTEEHARRLEQYGPNKLPESKRNEFLAYLAYINNPLSWAMEVAAIIAIALLDYADFALIVTLLFVNATISYVEEASADKAIKALAAALAPKAKAIRNGKAENIDAGLLVPGDIVIVAFGNIVPADIKLLGEAGSEDIPLQVDQAALTGESLPAKKFSGDVAFSGSTVKAGEKHCLVYATGTNTFFGRAAALISATNNVANLQKIMTKIGGTCLVTIFVWCIIELAVQFGHYGHSCSSGEEGCPTLTNMLVIVVGGIPIAMPTVLSVTLALGAFKLAKEGAIVARMSAVEEMAGMDILCSDKTGTLTLNQLSVDRDTVLAVSGRPLDDILRDSALSANIVGEEPIDVVLHESYSGNATLWDNYKLIRSVPFNPVDKYTIAIVQENSTGVVRRYMKGAPQVVLKKAKDYEAINTRVTTKITEFANRGYRALGVALADGDGIATGGVATGEWEMIGLIPLFDPPRHDTKLTIEQCREKGIMVKMVTGDQLLIGKETAKQLGMGTNMYTTEVLLAAKESGQGFGNYKNIDELVEQADGFAEVFPEHKYEIVKILQDLNHLVGMTGDGVNDAPALKKADVGIAVAGATDAARGAADIVLTEPGLSTIVTAIIGARKIFQRMTTYSKYTVAMTFRICFTFGLLTVIYNWYFPTILIVMLAVFNDGAMIALSKDKVVASRIPNTWNLKVIFITGIVYGLYLTLSTWVLYYVITHMTFFEDKLHLLSLNTMDSTLIPFCEKTIIPKAFNEANIPFTPTSFNLPVNSLKLLPNYKEVPASVTVLDQCLAEQKYVRDSMLRSVIYAQVSISGQAVVFVVRTISHSLMVRAGFLTYVAFFLAQVGSSVIAAFGFNGYSPPRNSVEGCAFCHNSRAEKVQFFSQEVPIAETESVFTASVIGCTSWVLVAWVWSIIWYMGLDPIKWAMAYILNEEGVRNKREFTDDMAHQRASLGPKPIINEVSGPVNLARVSYQNPLGRTSLSAPTAVMLERASVVTIERPRD